MQRCILELLFCNRIQAAYDQGRFYYQNLQVLIPYIFEYAYDSFTLDISPPYSQITNVSLPIISPFSFTLLVCWQLLCEYFYHSSSSNLSDSKYSICNHHALLEGIMFLLKSHNLYLTFNGSLFAYNSWFWGAVNINLSVINPSPSSQPIQHIGV